MRLIALLFLCVILQSNLYSAACSDAEQNKASRINFGVAPWMSAQVASLWSKKISSHFKATGCYKVSFQSKASYEKYIKSALAGKYDFIDLPPHIASYLITEHQYIPIAMEIYHADVVIFSNAETKNKQLSDLENKIFAVPDPLGLVTLIAQEELKSELKNQPNFNFFGTHDRVVNAVLSNQAAAGIVISPLINAYSPSRKKRIHIIKNFQQNHDGIIVAKPGIDAKVLTDIINTLISFEEKDSSLWQTWQAVDEDKIKKLHIQQKPYVEYIKKYLRKRDARITR